MGNANYIIVTGGLGFIGSNLIAKLEEFGYDKIIVIDSFGNSDKWKNIAKRNCICKVISPEDIFLILESLSESVQAIIHLGAISSTTEKDVDKLYITNYQLSVDLYVWCKQNSAQFIYASSASVYGDSKEFLDSDSVTDIHKLRPLNAYGWSKKLIDSFIANDGGFSEATNQNVALRFFNVYGPNEYHKGSQASVIYHFFNQIKNNGTVGLFKSITDLIKDGEQMRDFVYVEDCVKVIVWFLEHPNIKGIFNVGTGIPASFNDVAESIFNCLAQPKNIKYIDMPIDIQSHYQNYTIASLNKLRSAGCNETFRTIEYGIGNYIELLKQKDQYI